MCSTANRPRRGHAPCRAWPESPWDFGACNDLAGLAGVPLGPRSGQRPLWCTASGLAGVPLGHRSLQRHVGLGRGPPGTPELATTPRVGHLELGLDLGRNPPGISELGSNLGQISHVGNPGPRPGFRIRELEIYHGRSSPGTSELVVDHGPYSS